MGTWNKPGDPSVYSLVELDMTESIKFMKEVLEKHQIKLTPSHLVGWAVAKTMNDNPSINGMIRGSRIYLRQSVNVFYQVNIPPKEPGGKPNLAGTTIEAAETMNIVEIAKTLQEKALRVKEDRDKEIKSSFNIIKFVPWMFMRFFLTMSSWLLYGLNLDLRWLGMPRDPFGSVMVTNVGGFGVEIAWPPLVPYSRVPILLCVGAITDRPAVVDGQVRVRPMMSIGIVFDHRFMDGIQAGKMNREFSTYFANPAKYMLHPPKTV